MPYTVDLRGVQAPLKEKYRSDPATALVVTAAHSVASDLSDPRHCAVAPTEYPSVTISSGLHPAAGGAGDTPCSGDILAAALAICEESTLRSVAANMGVELESVHVDVRIHWDFRGTMGVDRDVPVGARKTSPVGVTPGAAAAPAGTMVRTMAIETGGCSPSLGVSVTLP